jgi:hypothetical protein
MQNLQKIARKSLRFVLGAGAMVTSAACGGADIGGDERAGEPTNDVDSTIVNGTPGGGVGVVRLWMTDGGGSWSLCTGTVISSHRVLTAGHCVDDWLTIRDGDGDATFILQADLFAVAEYTEDGSNWFCLHEPTSTTCPAWMPMHVSRLGNGEAGADIGVVRFDDPLEGIESSHFRGLSTGNVSVGRTVEEWGVGFTDAAGTGGASVTPVMMRDVVRTTSVTSTFIRTSDSDSQICNGDSGGPIFVGASDLIVGVLSRFGSSTVGECNAVNAQPGWARITPAVIAFINNNRQGADALCTETIAGTGFHDCS